MLELTLKFKPSDGSAERTITARIHNAQQTGKSWSSFVEVLGFDKTRSHHIQGADWSQAIEMAARIVPTYLQGLAADAGGGTFDPPVVAA